MNSAEYQTQHIRNTNQNNEFDKRFLLIVL